MTIMWFAIGGQMLLDAAARRNLRESLAGNPGQTASAVRAAYHLSPACSIRACYDHHGWPVRVRPLCEEPSTLRAVLSSLLSGGFSVVVNEQHQPDREQVEWLLAHEFAHTFFFTDDHVPRRCVPYTQREEVLCDAFADAFTGRVLASSAA